MNVATPAAFRTPVPIVPAPSLNPTLPGGVPAPAEVTVAVKVTDWPVTDGFTDDVSVVDVGVVPAAVTTWDTGAEVLALKAPLPR